MSTKNKSNSNLPAVAVERKIDLATWSCLSNSVFPGAKPESIVMAMDYCKARKLDILKKPCHIVPMSVTIPGTDQKERRDVIMPGIAEYRITASRTGEYVGQDEPEFGEEITFKGIAGPKWCKVTVRRLIQGEERTFSHVERFTEAVATNKDGKINSMWSRRPYGQLAKCAEAGALRKAFPEEFGGEYIAEEMEGKDLGPVDMGEVERVEEPTIREPQPKSKSSAQPTANTKQAAPDPAANNGGAAQSDGTPAIGDPQIRIINTKLKNNGVEEAKLFQQFGIGDLRQITMGRINEVLKWIGEQAQ